MREGRKTRAPAVAAGRRCRAGAGRCAPLIRSNRPRFAPQRGRAGRTPPRAGRRRHRLRPRAARPLRPASDPERGQVAPGRHGLRRGVGCRRRNPSAPHGTSRLGLARDRRAGDAGDRRDCGGRRHRDLLFHPRGHQGDEQIVRRARLGPQAGAGGVRSGPQAGAGRRWKRSGAGRARSWRSGAGPRRPGARPTNAATRKRWKKAAAATRRR